MKLPLISVMIPTYNQPQYIAQAVESALAQDYEKLEIVVSDDSTNDATEKLLQPYLADKRFSYFRNPAQLGRVANYRKLLFDPVDVKKDRYGWVYAPARNGKVPYNPLKQSSAYHL